MATTDTSLKLTAQFGDATTMNITIPNVDPTVTTSAVVKAGITSINTTNNIGSTFVSSGGVAFSKFNAAEIISVVTDNIYTMGA